ncbi:MAG: hypothetical protein AAF098_11375, partial [Pseudomonadota bacterium]
GRDKRWYRGTSSETSMTFWSRITVNLDGRLGKHFPRPSGAIPSLWTQAYGPESKEKNRK